MPQTVIVLDFGSQYTQVIARRIREANVYSKVIPFDTPINEIQADNPVGIILSGGPSSVLIENSPKPDPQVFELEIPVMGICYGLQLMGFMLGGAVENSVHREYGYGTLSKCSDSKLLEGLPNSFRVWNSHGDRLTKLPYGFQGIAKTDNSEFAVLENPEMKLLVYNTILKWRILISGKKSFTIFFSKSVAV